MRNKQTVLFAAGCGLVWLALLPWLAGAQFNGRPNDQISNPSLAISVPPKLFSLFDPQKFSMQHSYTFSVASDGKRTFSDGLYLNTMQYQFSAPLLFRLKWGLETPAGLQSTQALLAKPNLVVPSMELLYRPFKNMLFKVEYRTNTEYAPYAPYPISQANPFFE
jgi:hypothetical protein